MSTVQRIAKNTTVLLVAQIASYFLAFFYMMHTARYLGAAGFGILSFALAFTGIFGVFGDLGLGPLTVREVARDKSLTSKYLANVSLMKIILVTITFGLIALTINLMGYPEETIKVVYLLGLSIIFTAFTQMFYSIFQAFERMEYQGIGQMLNAALMLGGVILAIKLGFSIIGFASLYAIASIITLVYSFIVMRLEFSNPAVASATRVMELDWRFWKPTIKKALPFGLTGVFVMIYYYIDSVMLSLMKGDEVVGWYNAAYRLILIPLLIPIAFNSALFPVMSRFFISSKAALQFTYQRYFKYMVLLSIPIGIGATLLADRLILLIFGGEFAPSIIALQILIWSSVFIFMSSPFGRLLESLNKQIVVTKIVGICAVLNVILNLIFIPKYSYVAASATTVATEFTSLALCFIWSRKIGYTIAGEKLVGIFSRVLGASAVMGVFIVLFQDLTLLALIPSAALLYFMVLYIIRGIDKEDIALLEGAVRGKQKSI
ncbi:MAG: Lipopolysaccharide biosynthesis protein WzxC [Syntrophomonadaceae bacterium]|nr:Lipopolysaccharide biosynthesis protein WzxC [Bacillota bacterium]